MNVLFRSILSLSFRRFGCKQRRLFGVQIIVLFVLVVLVVLLLLSPPKKERRIVFNEDIEENVEACLLEEKKTFN